MSLFIGRPRIIGMFILAAILVVSEALSDEITACDRLAADQYDLMRVAPSIIDSELKASDAERACREILLEFPSTPRFQFQLARALFALGRVEEAANLAARAAKQSYPSAYYLLGVIHQQNSMKSQYNVESAIDYFLLAAEARHVPAAIKLYEAYLLGYGVEKNLHDAEKWIKLAANTGDPDAIYLYAVYLDQDSGRTAIAESFGLKMDISLALKCRENNESKMIGYGAQQMEGNFGSRMDGFGGQIT